MADKADIKTPPLDADAKEKPSFVFLRLKRKRTDERMDHLVVYSEPDAKRVKCGSTDLLQAFTNLSTTDQRFVFKHIDTMDDPITSGRGKWTERLKRKARSLKDEHAAMMAKKAVASAFQTDLTASKPTIQRVKQQQSRSKALRNEERLKARGLRPRVRITEKQTIEVHGIRLVDLQLSATSGVETNEQVDAEVEKSETDVVTVNGTRMKAMRVLNPYERELDEAIWAAFRSNEFASFFQIYHAQRSDFGASPTAFQRPADGTTVLMAAALHGRSDVIEVLLRSDSTCVLQEAWTGATATAFAKHGGHRNVETALLACEDVEREKDYVYDVYCVDTSASKELSIASGAATPSENGFERASVHGVPIVSVSSEVQQWLMEDVPSDEVVEEYMLESDIDSNEEDDGLSEDSNDEDNAANDYPDEESSDESLVDSDDLNEIGARRHRRESEDDHTERDEFDY